MTAGLMDNFRDVHFSLSAMLELVNVDIFLLEITVSLELTDQNCIN